MSLGIVAGLFVYEHRFRELVLQDSAHVVAEDPHDEAVLVVEVVVERLAVLARLVDDVRNGYLLNRRLIAQVDEGFSDEVLRIERIHPVLLQQATPDTHSYVSQEMSHMKYGKAANAVFTM